MATGDGPKTDGSGGGDQSALSYGLYLAVGVILGVVVGNWLDHKYGWGVKATITGAVLGMVSGMYLLIKEGMRAGK
jgi:F0F1-type ATP synthase assembly protein I